jgi:hypothetical protein
MRYLVDSCLVINYLRGKSKSKEFIEKITNSQVVAHASRITEVEIFCGENRNDLKRLEKILSVLSLFSIEEITRPIAREGGYIIYEYGHYMGDVTATEKMPIADAILAATAKLNDLVLYTSNIKHFRQLQKQGIIQCEEYKEE